MAFAAAPMLDANDLDIEGLNLVTIYVCPSKVDADAFCLPLAWPAAPTVPRTWRRTSHRCAEYTKKNMVYTYDVATDGQRNVTHRILGEKRSGHYYITFGAEDVMPCHRFPCTREIDDVAYIDRDVYKVHHRLSFVVDRVADKTQAMYFKYTHGPQVDVAQILGVIHDAVGAIKTR